MTNVPGPQFPLYMLGRELVDLFPIAFLPKNHGLAIAIMSYNGAIDFGLLGDYDAMGDLDVFGDYLEESLAELLKAARKQNASAARANGSKKSAPGKARSSSKAPAPGQS